MKEMCKNCPCVDSCIFVDSKEKCPYLIVRELIYASSLIPTPLQQRVSLEAVDFIDLDVFKELKELSLDVLNFVKGGQNLFLWSSIHGNGKLSWAMRFVQEYIHYGWTLYDGLDDVGCPVLYVNTAQLSSELLLGSANSKYLQYLRDRVYKADLVIWDGICRRPLTPKEQEIFYGILDLRINSKKSNIFVSTVAYNNIEPFLGKDLFYRISKDSMFFEFKGPDMREIKQRTKSTKEIV